MTTWAQLELTDALNNALINTNKPALHIGNTPICKCLKHETFVLLNELLQFLEFSFSLTVHSKFVIILKLPLFDHAAFLIP